MDTTHSRNLRSPSLSSDVMSNSSRSVTTSASVPQANPPPAYVSQTEASKLISAELERPVIVSQAALALVNEFLDQVLYSIISTSHSVALGQLTIAVPTVLKPRLGKAALRVAEEELKEYLEDGEEAELTARRGIQQTDFDFDSDLVWKVARLRCMVYARLGDLEEEDEEEWLEKEQLLEQAAVAQKNSKQSLEVGPGAAIFLTSVIEYLGEQALYYAAQHAQKRHDSVKNPTTPTTDMDNPLPQPRDQEIVLEGKDMNHVGRDSPLSRLWRSWRRNTRSVNESFSRPLSPEMSHSAVMDSPGGGRRSHAGHHHSISSIAEENLPGTSGSTSQPKSPSLMPLPESDGELEDNAPDDADLNASKTMFESQRKRPISMGDMPGRFPSYASATPSDQPELPERSPLRPSFSRNRSQSLPTTSLTFTSLTLADGKVMDPSEDAEDMHEQGKGDDQTIPAGQESEESDSKAKPGGSGLINTTIASMASALGIVGVHHVVQPDPEEHEDEAPSVTTPEPQQLTRASITGPSDFDQMHVPQGRETPNEAQPALEEEDNEVPTKSSHEPSADSADVPANDREDEVSHSVNGDASEVDGQPVSKPHVAAGIVSRSPDRKAETRDAKSASINQPYDQILGQHKPIHTRDQSKASQYSHHSKSSSSSSRLLGFTRDGQGKPQTIHQQRAAGDMADDVRAAYSPTPTHATRGSRPDTSHSVEPKRPHARIRSDSEELLTTIGTDQEGAKRSLDVLINSDETLHYTLTPASAATDGQQAPSSPKRTATQDLADFLRSTGPPGTEVPKKTSRSSRQSSEYSNPSPLPQSRASGERRFIPSSKNITPLPASSPRAKNRIGEPRDAKVGNASETRDLADYARSTGPSDETQLPKALSGRVASPNGSLAQSRPATQASKPQNRLKFQARDPRPSRNAETTDLIDFIREGPPRTTGEHRINRQVAPFRTTMDSDDFNALAGGTDHLRVSDSTMDTSVNSQTALLNKSQPANGAVPPIPTINGARRADTDGGPPKRKQSRVKDPYAIDDSDDELEGGASAAPGSQEESLIDFLRNTAPPPSMTAPPVLTIPEESAPSPVVHRSPSAARLRDLVRNARSPTPTSANRSSAIKSQSTARAESPHLTQIGTKRDTYRPTQVTHAAHVDKYRNKSRTGSSSATGPAYGETADLAEYLRSTGPPPGYQQETQPFVLSQSTLDQHLPNGEPKEEAGIKKFFSLKGRNKS